VSITSARLIGGRYQLHTMLGRGGMAAVWAGIDTRLDRPVAVKVLDGAASADSMMVQRFDQEARTVARLAHPNVVAVYDVGIEGNVPYLVMELVEGQDLQRRVASGPLDVGQALGIAAQVCDALAAAHRAGVVHRDIKPANILLTRAGTVKICDFGIARLQQATQVQLTRPATTVGTSEYMAPEQAAGGPLDARTDLYSFGCVLYAMLTGGPPFSGDSPVRVLWQQIHEPPPPLAARREGIPAELQALILELLSKNPADRPEGAADVRARLARLADSPAAMAATAGAAVLAGPPPAAAYARAAVVTPTRTMPAIDTQEQSPTRGGFRLGPVGIAAVAICAAVVTALVVALLSAGTRTPQAAGPANTGDGSTSTSASAAASTAAAPGTAAAVLAAIQAQVRAGQLDADGAKDLTDKLDDVERNLARGRTGDAAQKLDDVRDRLNDIRHDGNITTAGYTAILSAIDHLAESLPQNNRGSRN
jgi:eukaryotic-like serine/threonine-protein kinase